VATCVRFSVRLGPSRSDFRGATLGSSSRTEAVILAFPMNEPTLAWRSSFRRNAWLLAACLGLLLFKLWLIEGSDVHAHVTQYDQLRFAEMADSIRRGDWLGPYNHLTLIRQPVYPAWVAVVSMTGLRLRIAAELLLALAALAFALSLRTAGAHPGVAVLALVAATLHPGSFYYNAELRAETFYTPLLLLVLAGLIRIASVPATPGLSTLFWTGLSLGLLWHTRPESELLVLPVLFVGLGAVRAGASARAGRRGWAAPVALATLVPLLPVLVFGSCLRAWNHRRYGVAVVTELAEPAFVAAQEGLWHIRPERPRPFVTIPRSSRQLAYAASPTLRQVAPYLEGSVGTHWSRPGCRDLGVCDDIANGWFAWALRDAVAASGESDSAVRAESFYRRVAEELSGAQRDGQLPVRSTAAALQDGLEGPGRFVAAMFEAAAALRAWRFRPSLEDDATPEGVRELFDRVANRRRSPQMECSEIVGWVAAAGDTVVNVGVDAGKGRFTCRDHPSRNRLVPLDSSWSGGTNGEPRAHFTVVCDVSPTVLASGQPLLVFALGRAGRAAFPLREGVEDGVVLSVGIESIKLRRGGLEPRAGLVRGLGRAYGLLATTLAWSGGFAGLALLIRARRIRWWTPPFFPLLLLVLVLASRVSLVAFLRGSALATDSLRYLYPVLPLYAVTAALTIQAGLLAWSGTRVR